MRRPAPPTPAPSAPPSAAPPSAAPAWRAQLDEIAAVLAEARGSGPVPRLRGAPPLRAEVAALIRREAGDALAPAAVERLADTLAVRVARALAA
jgi:hypothetical protein